MKKLFIFVLISALPAISIAQNQENINSNLKEKKRELKKIQIRMEKKKKELAETAEKKKQVLEQLNAIELDLDKSKKKIRNINNLISDERKKIKKVERDINLLEQKIFEQKRKLKTRMVALYKYGKTGPREILFSSDSYITLFKRKRFMQLILAGDMENAYEYGKNMETYKTKKTQLEKKYLNLKNLKNELVNNKKKLSDSRAEKKSLLALVNSSKKMHEASIKELKISSLKLKKMIDSLLASIDADIALNDNDRFTHYKGKMEMPANGNIVGFFGRQLDPKFNTVIFNNGIEIALPEGGDIKAIFNGKVIYADWFKGYGKVIIINHGEGYYSLSAHASKLLKKAGDTALRGEVIGLAGDTGSFSGSNLYFEIRHKGKTIDPLEWLKTPGKKL